MRTSAQHFDSIPFAQFDAKCAPLIRPAVQTTGEITGLTVTLPEAPPASGIQVKIWQDSGAVVSSGLMVGKFQQCNTSGGTYEDLHTFNSAGANDHQEAIVTVTKQFVKYIGTVTGTSIAIAAGVMY